MTITYINTGSSANAGNGDTLRLAFTKINSNFSELVDQISTIELGSTSTLVAGTYTFALTNTGTITLNDAPFVSGAGATGATGPTGAGFSNLTSTSSNSISTGTLTFTVNQTQGVESAFMGGQYVLAYAGTLGNVEGGVYGQIYSYSDQTLILASYEVLFGSGTTSSWYFELTGAKGIDGTIGINGATGATGPAGPTNTATTATLGGIIVGHNLSVTAEGTLSAITSITSDVAPADPVEGDQWWDSNLGRGFVYYSGIWVEMSPQTGGSGAVIDLTNVDSDILPAADLTYDLGSTASQWRSLYVGTGTIYIGGVALGVSSDNYVTVNGNPIITVNTSGNLTVQGNTNLVLGSVAISDIAPDATTPGSQWFNTVEGRTYIATNGVWLDASPTQIPSPETYLDDITVDGSTLYINSSTLTISTSGTLLVNGSEVTGSGGGSGWQLTSSTSVVSLTSDGTLTLPNGSSISDGTGAIRLEPSGVSSSTQALVIYPTAVDGNHIHLTADGGETDLYLGDDNQYVKVDHSGTIVISTLGANISTWVFGTDGVLTLSTASTILGNSEDPNVYIETLTTSTTNTWTFGTAGNLDLPAGGDITQNGNSVLYPKVDTVSTTSMTFITTDQSIIFADPTVANGTVDLYLPDNPPEGKNYTVKNISAGTTLVGTSGPTIYLETEFGLYSSGTYATINVTNAAITWVFSNNGYRIINIFGLV